MSTTNKTKDTAADEAKNELATNDTTDLALSGTDELVFDSNDIIIPRINIIQKLSEIEGDLGSIVIAKEHQLADAGEELFVYVARADKAWKEDIPYNDDQIPRIARTPAELAELKAESDHELIEFADITLLIPAPEGREQEEEVFPFPIGDHSYALGKLMVAKDGYRQCFKPLASYKAFHPNASIYERMWRFKSDEISRGKYTWFAPRLSVATNEAVQSAGHAISEEAVAFCKQFASV